MTTRLAPISCTAEAIPSIVSSTETIERPEVQHLEHAFGDELTRLDTAGRRGQVLRRPLLEHGDHAALALLDAFANELRQRIVLPDPDGPTTMTEYPAGIPDSIAHVVSFAGCGNTAGYSWCSRRPTSSAPISRSRSLMNVDSTSTNPSAATSEDTTSIRARSAAYGLSAT